MSDVIAFINMGIRSSFGDVSYRFLGEIPTDIDYAHNRFPEAILVDVGGFVQSVAVQNKLGYKTSFSVDGSGKIKYYRQDGKNIPHVKMSLALVSQSPEEDWYKVGYNHVAVDQGIETIYTRNVDKRIYAVIFETFDELMRWASERGGNVSKFDQPHNLAILPSYQVKIDF